MVELTEKVQLPDFTFRVPLKCSQLVGGHFYEVVLSASQGVREAAISAQFGIGVFRYSVNFGLEGTNTLVIYQVTEETYSGSSKAALVRVHHLSVIV